MKKAFLILIIGSFALGLTSCMDESEVFPVPSPDELYTDGVEGDPIPPRD